MGDPERTPASVSSFPADGVTLDPARLDGALFDMDGVITSTAGLHERAWADAFTPMLRVAGAAPFSHRDYRTYLDGRPRSDGARAFLVARGLDAAETTVERVANAKNRQFGVLLEKDGAVSLPGASALLAACRAAGLRSGLFTASRNATRVLASVGLSEAFDARVDGLITEREGLAGKPAPDTPLACARLLGLAPARCALFEDSIAGMTAGVAGGFALLVGIGRGMDADRLREAGAQIVVPSLAAVRVLDRQRRSG